MPGRSLLDLGKTRVTKELCACFAMRKAARSVTRFYTDHLNSTEIGASQHSLLIIAYLSEGMTISRMADIAVMDRTTLTRNLKPLQRQQLITIKPGEDRRQKIVAITRKGISLLKKIMPGWEKAQQKLERKLGSEKFDNLITDLSEVVTKLKE
ncbi:MAG: MarR family winged helix-turn-helix transcriptional regulator [Gammaproteobacteria bacterium]